MNRHLIPLGGVLALVLLVTGCETDGGLSARIQEKSAVYATLKPWQKKYVDKGTVAIGLTPDMVYIAMGRADKVEAKDLPEGHAELWTYSRYYPTTDALHGFRTANFNLDSAYQPQMATMQTNVSRGDYANGAPGTTSPVPTGMDRAGGESIGKTGGPQGGSMEPADLPSYTIKILFENGKVTRIGATPNPN